MDTSTCNINYFGTLWYTLKQVTFIFESFAEGKEYCPPPVATNPPTSEYEVMC